MNTEMDTESSEQKKQKQRVFLRERFLRMLCSLWDTPTEFKLYNNTKVQAKFCCSDIEVHHFQVDQLKTPMGTHPSALLRTSDILSLSMELPNRATNMNNIKATNDI